MAFLAVLGATGSLMIFHRRPKIVGRLHTGFALGRRGELFAEVVTIVGTALVLGGLVLWWRRKRLTVRVRSGWRVALNDLHHVTGVMASLLLLVMCVSATVMWRTRVPPPPRPTADGAAPAEPVTLADRRRLHRLARQLHAVEGMGRPIKLLYFLGSASLVLLGVSGFTMWWKPRRPEGT